VVVVGAEEAEVGEDLGAGLLAGRGGRTAPAFAQHRVPGPEEAEPQLLVLLPLVARQHVARDVVGQRELAAAASAATAATAAGRRRVERRRRPVGRRPLLVAVALRRGRHRRRLLIAAPARIENQQKRRACTSAMTT